MIHENKWKSRLVKDFRDINALVLSVHGHAMQAPGWPDIYVHHPIWTGWIELKMPRGELSTAQRIIGRRLGPAFRCLVYRDDSVCDIISAHGGVLWSSVKWTSATRLLTFLANHDNATN